MHLGCVFWLECAYRTVRFKFLFCAVCFEEMSNSLLFYNFYLNMEPVDLIFIIRYACWFREDGLCICLRYIMDIFVRAIWSYIKVHPAKLRSLPHFTSHFKQLCFHTENYVNSCWRKSEMFFPDKLNRWWSGYISPSSCAKDNVLYPPLHMECSHITENLKFSNFHSKHWLKLHII